MNQKLLFYWAFNVSGLDSFGMGLLKQLKRLIKTIVYFIDEVKF